MAFGAVRCRRWAGEALSPSSTVLAGDVSSPCILHVPHASQLIPDDVRTGILLDDHDHDHDHELELELRAMTDVHTDLIAARAAELVHGPRPWMFTNRLSRLVVDPERFPDEREVMNAAGMGAVYTRTSTGEPLRDDDPQQRAALISTRFDPYAAALAGLVDERLDATGHAVILDIHSYPRDPLPYELFADEARPEICLGCDENHTPPWLRSLAHDALAPGWGVGVNRPFHGTYVPLRHYGCDDRVTSLMLEIRRDTYVRPDGGPDQDAIMRLAGAIAALIDAITPLPA